MSWKHVISLAAILGAVATVKLEAQSHVLISSAVPTSDEVSLPSPAWARVREQMILAVQRDLRTLTLPATAIQSVEGRRPRRATPRVVNAKRRSASTAKIECLRKGKEKA